MAGGAAAHLRASAQNPPSVAPPPQVAIDVVAVDREGRIPDTLGAEDLTVTVDGALREVLWVRRVSRGPGATSDAAARSARGTGETTFAAEPHRTVLVVVDQAGLVRGDERQAIQAAGAFLDRLGIEDRVTIVRLPVTANTEIALTTDRPVAREALALVTGQAARAADTLLEQPKEPVRNVAVDPNRELEIEPVVTPEAERAQEAVGLAGLLDLMNALRPMPGRKVIALVSEGLAGQAASPVDRIAAAAVAAHAVVYAFGVPSSRGDASAARDIAPLEALARSTGGAFVALARNPQRGIERVVTELSACFVLGLQAGEHDADGRPHALRVETTRKSVTLRSAAWLVPVPDVADAVPPAPELAAPVAPAGAAAGSGASARPAAAPPAREADLALALARLTEYVSGYERQYSGLVAEEDYRQSTQAQRVRLRSDFLLVKPQGTEGWVSFRDVFEVDGHAVRDRDDRLKRLFLDPNPAALARLKAVKDESARYNIGPVERNINVPLFPLVFLSRENRLRFEFKLTGDRESAGLRVWRIEYVERARPTIIKRPDDRDVPVSGWFLVDQMTGVIVETTLELEEPEFVATIEVRYRRDAGLGLWVPVRMHETYKATESRSASPGLGQFWSRQSMEGEATYSNFRRFQVKTEEKIAIPK